MRCYRVRFLLIPRLYHLWIIWIPCLLISRRAYLLHVSFIRISHRNHRAPHREVAQVLFFLHYLFRAIATFGGGLVRRRDKPPYYPEPKGAVGGSICR